MSVKKIKITFLSPAFLCGEQTENPSPKLALSFLLSSLNDTSEKEVVCVKTYLEVKIKATRGA